MRSAIKSEAVSRSFLITPRWLPRDTPVSSTNKKMLQESNSKLVILCGGRLSACLLLRTDVSMSKLLPRDEFVKLKQQWLHCDELNGKAAAKPGGKKSYVVFNGHLMARAFDETLNH